MPTPRREIAISEEIVHRLLLEQRPDLADLKPVIVGEGWDNVTARIGGRLAMRLPRREVAADLIVREQQWLPIARTQIAGRNSRAPAVW